MKNWLNDPLGWTRSEAIIFQFLIVINAILLGMVLGK